MDILVSYASAQIIVKKSRFLAEAFVVTTQAEARTILKAQKQKYQDASHVVHCFCVGLAGEVLGSSDDGEPSGTAGRPMLDVLKGRGVTNILITVTRWFGGTLLGTGGLVKAYGDATKALLDVAITEPYIAKTQFTLNLPYNLYDGAKNILRDFSVTVDDESFAEQIVITGTVNADKKEPLSKALFDFSRGTVNLL